MTVVVGARAAGLSDTGLTRSSNEDALLTEPPLYAVADGMGGHRAGEIASRVALDELLAAAPRRADVKALGRAARAANRAVIEAADKSRTREGMGTTLTAAMVDGTRIVIAHVGDSRAYLLHGRRLEQLTEDHSMVADLMRQGSLTAEEARFHPQRSVITRALGSDVNMPVDTLEVDASNGDRLLLCTDGLTGMLSDERIAEILASETEPEAAVQALIAAANAAGGYDNITAVVVDMSAESAGRPGGPDPADARRRKAARWLWMVTALALVAAAIWGSWSYARSRAYLIDEAGMVTVYRGVPGSFAGMSLHWRVAATDIPVSSLELPVALRLKEGIPFPGLRAALGRVAELRASEPATAPVQPPSSTESMNP